MAKQEHLIGRWRFAPDEAVLRSDGAERRLEDRAARALELLCERRGEIVSSAIFDGRWTTIPVRRLTSSPSASAGIGWPRSPRRQRAKSAGRLAVVQG